MGAELFHADIRTDKWTDGHADITWIIVAFRNFANAPHRSIYVPRVDLYSTRNLTKAKLCIVEYMSSVLYYGRGNSEVEKTT